MGVSFSGKGKVKECFTKVLLFGVKCMEMQLD